MDNINLEDFSAGAGDVIAANTAYSYLKSASQDSGESGAVKGAIGGLSVGVVLDGALALMGIPPVVTIVTATVLGAAWGASDKDAQSDSPPAPQTSSF